MAPACRFHAGEPRYDQWIHTNGRSTRAFCTRHYIPFFYSLADAFTICDAYHCSLLGATDPNRWYNLSVVASSDPGFLRRLAGHLENGRDSVSDPTFGSSQS